MDVLESIRNKIISNNEYKHLLKHLKIDLHMTYIYTLLFPELMKIAQKMPWKYYLPTKAYILKNEYTFDSQTNYFEYNMNNQDIQDKVYRVVSGVMIVETESKSHITLASSYNNQIEQQYINKTNYHKYFYTQKGCRIIYVPMDKLFNSNNVEYLYADIKCVKHCNIKITIIRHIEKLLSKDEHMDYSSSDDSSDEESNINPQISNKPTIGEPGDMVNLIPIIIPLLPFIPVIIGGLIKNDDDTIPTDIIEPTDKATDIINPNDAFTIEIDPLNTFQPSSAMDLGEDEEDNDIEPLHLSPNLPSLINHPGGAQEEETKEPYIPRINPVRNPRPDSNVFGNLGRQGTITNAPGFRTWLQAGRDVFSLMPGPQQAAFLAGVGGLLGTAAEATAALGAATIAAKAGVDVISIVGPALFSGALIAALKQFIWN
jgi:hypothetical protein